MGRGIGVGGESRVVLGMVRGGSGGVVRCGSCEWVVGFVDG